VGENDLLRRLLILAALLPLAGCPRAPSGSGNAKSNGPLVAEPRQPPNQPKAKPTPRPRSGHQLVILDTLDWSARYLAASGVSLKRNDGSMHLSIRNSKRAATALAGACLALRQRMNLIAQNVSNAETSRLPTLPAGSPPQPYRRRTLVVGAKGGLEVVEDKSAFRKVYRPGHPDANKDGNVLLPNVYVAVELHDWRTSFREYEILRLALARLSSNYVAPPAALFSEPKPPPPYEPKKSAPKPTRTTKPKPKTKPKTVPVKKP
jgi:flagellar basal-body rod protein FlgC